MERMSAAQVKGSQHSGQIGSKCSVYFTATLFIKGGWPDQSTLDPSSPGHLKTSAAEVISNTLPVSSVQKHSLCEVTSTCSQKNLD